MIETKFFARMGLLLSSATLGMQAFAQSITYAPAASSIPTVSEWGLMLLSLVLVSAAFIALRNKKSKVLMAWFMAGSMALAVGGGGWLMSEAWAIPDATLSSDSGGTLVLSGYSGEFPVSGHPTLAMRIVDVTPASLSTTGSPTCEAGRVVNAGGVCYVRFDSCDAASGAAAAGTAC